MTGADDLIIVTFARSTLDGFIEQLNRTVKHPGGMRQTFSWRETEPGHGMIESRYDLP